MQFNSLTTGLRAFQFSVFFAQDLDDDHDSIPEIPTHDAALHDEEKEKEPKTFFAPKHTIMVTSHVAGIG